MCVCVCVYVCVYVNCKGREEKLRKNNVVSESMPDRHVERQREREKPKIHTHTHTHTHTHVQQKRMINV